jgi:hypothetical protein
MSKSSRTEEPHVQKGLFFFLLAVFGFFWCQNGPSNQELLANYAKSKDVWDLIYADKGSAWWTPNYLGGCLAVLQP